LRVLRCDIVDHLVSMDVLGCFVVTSLLADSLLHIWDFRILYSDIGFLWPWWIEYSKYVKKRAYIQSVGFRDRNNQCNIMK